MSLQSPRPASSCRGVLRFLLVEKQQQCSAGELSDRSSLGKLQTQKAGKQEMLNLRTCWLRMTSDAGLLRAEATSSAILCSGSICSSAQHCRNFLKCTFSRPLHAKASTFHT